MKGGGWGTLDVGSEEQFDKITPAAGNWDLIVSGRGLLRSYNTVSDSIPALLLMLNMTLMQVEPLGWKTQESHSFSEALRAASCRLAMFLSGDVPKRPRSENTGQARHR